MSVTARGRDILRVRARVRARIRVRLTIMTIETSAVMDARLKCDERSQPQQCERLEDMLASS